MDDDFFNKLLDTFKIEARDHVKSISSGLFELEGKRDPSEAQDVLESVYRQAHSLKGAARAVGFTEVENTCQAMESVFAAIRDGNISPDSNAFDLLHESVDTVEDMIFSSTEKDATDLQKQLLNLASGKGAAGGKPVKNIQPPDDMFQEPASLESPDRPHLPDEDSGQAPGPAPAPHRESIREKFDTIMADTRVGAETIRISVEKLEHLLVKAEEMLSVKLAVAQRSADLRDLMTDLSEWKRRWDEISPFVDEPSQESAVDEAKVKEFLAWNGNLFSGLNERLKTVADSATSDSRSLGEMVNDLLEDMKTVLMVPCSSLLDVFPRVVRDLSKELGKEVELRAEGASVEIDRRILEEMKDPLIHLVRNAIDHGLETPEKRVAKGKPRRGSLTVSFSGIGGGKAEIVVADDGGGIDPERVREAAEKAGPSDRGLSQGIAADERLDLIFRSGVSTSPIVSHISGRGLGLAIVREKVDNLGGRVELETTIGRGTTFRITLPLSLATFRGILVECADTVFVAPTSAVARALRFDKGSIKTEQGIDTIEFEGLAIPLISLGKALELPASNGRSKDPAGLIQALALRAEDSYCAFIVDSIIGEQEVLVKSLGKQLQRVRNIAGATILGNGRLAGILNTRDLVKTGARASVGPSKVSDGTEGPQEPKEVLVAEDSITSRMLIKNILESAGFKVTTSVDGAQAWSKLKSGKYDLVVSDVEMPNMNGFELTAKIRADPELSDLPVAIVTGLGSKEHMERGIDVGASAYIVKSGFEEGDLIDVVKRLI